MNKSEHTEEYIDEWGTKWREERDGYDRSPVDFPIKNWERRW